MKKFLSKLFGIEGDSDNRRTGRAHRRADLQVECLEERRLLAASVTVNPGTGWTTVTGTSYNDTVQVKFDTKGTPSFLDDQFVVTLSNNNGEFVKAEVPWASSPKGVNCFLKGGHDSFDNQTGLESVVDGGIGNDTLKGGNSKDFLVGGLGQDRLYGRMGDDSLLGGTFVIWGPYTPDNSTDYLYGEAGNDTLKGSEGDDEMYGDSETDPWDAVWGGHDVLYGDAGFDHLYAGGGNDTVYGGLHGDIMTGNNGNDLMYGEDGIDTMFGDHGSDTMYGGAHGDYIYGSDQVDWLYGEGGDDELHGDFNNGLDPYVDHLDGGPGSDDVNDD